MAILSPSLTSPMSSLPTSTLMVTSLPLGIIAVSLPTASTIPVNIMLIFCFWGGDDPQICPHHSTIFYFEFNGLSHFRQTERAK
ncbi:Uncharacterised protein [Vibrio cholerae]|nr:Uncharacterised protein [Vibrio cholerae]CSI63087.1 Uncharacterised protein [Vibrio cholerae]